MIDIYLAFLAGLFGGVHCAGMCGPIVAAYSLNYTGTYVKRIVLHFLYNFGRIYTYAILGGIAGFAGSFFEMKSNLYFFAKIVKVFSSIFIIWIGLSIAGLTHKLFKEKTPDFLKKIFQTLISSPSKIALLGFFIGFLPCGLVYALLLKSATSGGFINGALIMIAFGAGTVPSLLFIGLFSDTLKMKLKEAFLNAAGVIIAGLGILTLIRELKN